MKFVSKSKNGFKAVAIKLEKDKASGGIYIMSVMENGTKFIEGYISPEQKFSKVDCGIIPNKETI